jgi:hypothetical protein
LLFRSVDCFFSSLLSAVVGLMPYYCRLGFAMYFESGVK